MKILRKNANHTKNSIEFNQNVISWYQLVACNIFSTKVDYSMFIFLTVRGKILRFRLEVALLLCFGTFVWLLSELSEVKFSWNVFLRDWMEFPFKFELLDWISSDASVWLLWTWYCLFVIWPLSHWLLLLLVAPRNKTKINIYLQYEYIQPNIYVYRPSALGIIYLGN